MPAIMSGQSLQPMRVVHDLPALQLSIAPIGLYLKRCQMEEPPVTPFLDGIPACGSGETSGQFGVGFVNGRAVRDPDVDHDHVVRRPKRQPAQPGRVEVTCRPAASDRRDHNLAAVPPRGNRDHVRSARRTRGGKPQITILRKEGEDVRLALLGAPQFAHDAYLRSRCVAKHLEAARRALGRAALDAGKLAVLAAIDERATFRADRYWSRWTAIPDGWNTSWR